MTYHRKARPCPFGLIPEEDVCGKHPHCIAHKEPVSTCPERWRGKPHEQIAELKQLRRRVAVLETVVIQNARFLLGCPIDYQIITCDRQYCYSKDNRDCWTAALAQAEGGE